MDGLLIDCTGGARKDSLVDQLLAHLDQPAQAEFVHQFNAMGLGGVEAHLELISRDGEDVGIPHFAIESEGTTENHAHAHGHHHHEHRSLGDVGGIINSLQASKQVKQDAMGIYQILGQAEAAAHDAPMEEIHFHEVGNNFAIGYIVAFCMLMEKLSPELVTATPITTGFGFVDCAHGRLPIPAPATANVLSDMQTVAGDVEGELTTPTGAAMVRYFTEA